ncbi:MAG: aminoacyl-tRNA hydrolase [Planctomycetaceae bacterium]|nr:aminoacyl-tRNA hydrolase [Planctomycetaceae bacterium]
MKLVIGLGNPGSKYKQTRHNIGFDVVAELARRSGSGSPQMKFQAEYRDAMIRSEKVLLITPLTFMNLSGESVQQFVRFYRTEPTDLAVICDDMNLPVGKLRWRTSGSAGGQKGLADIIRRLGYETFPRLRIGVGRPPAQTDPVNWVLGRFSAEERSDADIAVVRAADSVECWISDGIDSTMCEFNRSPDGNG